MVSFNYIIEGKINIVIPKSQIGCVFCDKINNYVGIVQNWRKKQQLKIQKVQ